MVAPIAWPARRFFLPGVLRGVAFRLLVCAARVWLEAAVVRQIHRARCVAGALPAYVCGGRATQEQAPRSATPCCFINDNREGVDPRGQKRPRRPGSHRGHQLRPRGQERPGETQLGSAMLSLLRRLMTRKGSSLNEPERKILQAKAGMPAPRSGSRTLATRRFRWGKVLGFPPQKGVGLRVLSQDFGRLPRELPQQVHFRVVLDFGQPINGHFDGHGALDYPGGRERCWIAREFLEENVRRRCNCDPRGSLAPLMAFMPSR